jgi:hypothetical protein
VILTDGKGNGTATISTVPVAAGIRWNRMLGPAHGEPAFLSGKPRVLP